MKTKDYISLVATILIVVILCIFHRQIYTTTHLLTSRIEEHFYGTSYSRLYGGICDTMFHYEQMATSGEILKFRPKISEEDVYTFLQGPKAWEEQVPWSGEWCHRYAKGHYFGGFGCGFCCMANIYSTLTDYECSPYDTYEYARSVSGYAPMKKSAALGWGDMKVCLKKMGFSCDLYYKPDSYKEFQEQMRQCKSAVVLVCSKNDDTYWKKTPGHYVNLWLYDEYADDVFLAEPGSKKHNRQRIPLRYVYDALKTTSQFQYLLVDGYKEENNLWKHEKTEDVWVRP